MKICEVCGTTNGKIYSKQNKFKMQLCIRHYNQMCKQGRILEDVRNEVIFDNDIVEIVIYKGDTEIARAIIDIDDYDKVKGLKFSLGSGGYVGTTIDSKRVRLHRVIKDCPDGMVIDHINHNKCDNRKSNLRICTYQENGQNMEIRSSNTSGCKGVCWDRKYNKWMAYIRVNYKHITLGKFINIKDAIVCRKEAEDKYFGEFAYKEAQ